MRESFVAACRRIWSRSTTTSRTTSATAVPPRANEIPAPRVRPTSIARRAVSGRLPHRGRRARRQALRRRAPAHRHRAGDPQAPVHPDLRRGDERTRKPDGARDRAGTRTHPARPHRARHRASSRTARARSPGPTRSSSRSAAVSSNAAPAPSRQRGVYARVGAAPARAGAGVQQGRFRRGAPRARRGPAQRPRHRPVKNTWRL